jgi:hypothetical protein
MKVLRMVYSILNDISLEKAAKCGCCYITVDSAMAASQNGFCSYKLSFHKKTNIMQIMTKNIKIFIYLVFYHREIVKLDNFITLPLSYANTVLWRSRCKIHRFVAAPKCKVLRKMRHNVRFPQKMCIMWHLREKVIVSGRRKTRSLSGLKNDFNVFALYKSSSLVIMTHSARVYFLERGITEWGRPPVLQEIYTFCKWKWRYYPTPRRIQSARLSLQPSELAPSPPQPLANVAPPPGSKGGHTRLRQRGQGGQFGRTDSPGNLVL